MLDTPASGRASRLWLCCALLLVLCGTATAQFKDFRQKWNLTRQDVVVAMPVDKNHLTLAKGSRIWRRVRLCLVTTASGPLPMCDTTVAG